jgi:hypothetical protein
VKIFHLTHRQGALLALAAWAISIACAIITLCYAHLDPRLPFVAQGWLMVAFGWAVVATYRFYLTDKPKGGRKGP